MKKIVDIKNRIKEFIIRHKKILIIIFVLISLILTLFTIKFNNTVTIANSNINSNNNTNLIYVKVEGEVNNPNTFIIDKEMYLFDFLIDKVSLTDYSDIDNMNLVEKIDSSCIIDIKRSDIKKDNTIEIIDMSKEIDKVYTYFGRIDGKIKIYEFDTSYTYKEIFWYTGFTSSTYDLNEYINSDTCFISANNTNKVCINTASIADLITLNGIGNSVASKIIEYRNTYGLFKTIEDIKNVSGIGDTIFNKIKDYICVN